MAAALALSGRARGRTAPNPNVGCVIVREGRVIGRGWTQPGGRPHAEAVALAGTGARGADVFVTLEPCAHASERGPACADLLAETAPARVIIAARDPDPRTDGKGIDRLRAAGIEVIEDIAPEAARRVMPGYFSRREKRRPHVALKLAISLDGRIAFADGTSRWITGEAARTHAHLERARTELIVVGGGTLRADAPKLNVRLEGLADRSPRRAVLSRQVVPDGWLALDCPEAVVDLPEIDHVLVEGGASAAAAFLAAGLVDRLLIYRAPIVIGAGLAAIGDIGLADLAAAHGRWRLADTRALGVDRLEVYERG